MGEQRNYSKLLMVGKSEEVGFKARKKVRTSEQPTTDSDSAVRGSRTTEITAKSTD